MTIEMNRMMLTISNGGFQVDVRQVPKCAACTSDEATVRKVDAESDPRLDYVLLCTGCGAKLGSISIHPADQVRRLPVMRPQLHMQ